MLAPAESQTPSVNKKPFGPNVGVKFQFVTFLASDFSPYGLSRCLFMFILTFLHVYLYFTNLYCPLKFLELIFAFDKFFGSSGFFQFLREICQFRFLLPVPDQVPGTNPGWFFHSLFIESFP